MKLVAVALTISCVACYTATGVPHDALPSGARVYVELTEPGTRELARFVGPNIREVYGDVREGSGANLVLALRSVTDRRAIETPWTGELVTIPHAEIAAIRERKLSRKRSWLFAAAVTAALVATGR